ncbi:MAG TPA: large conductance mechanosensitive channel protein MscL [Deltaproteobacteria bacterium]|nr:large conductance mechanosensitive channel protein MscL [Deltaproteobacteria bacterium]
MWKEFKEFISKGNAIDLAVGVVIGAAFGKIVSSFVDDIIMPPIGLMLGKVDFSNLYWLLKEGRPAGPYASLAEAKQAGAVVLAAGSFVNTLINFFIIAIAVFILVKFVNRLRRRPEAVPNTKSCPYCKSAVALDATRCAFCTSELSELKS